MTEYDYTKSPVAIDRLTQEIQQSSITIALDHINLYGTSLSIFFRSDLPTEDKSALDTIVAAHDGTPLIQNAPGQVQTRFERTDLVLKCCRQFAPFGASGIAEMSIKIPADGRFIAGGYAFTDSFTPGDCVTAISVTDVDNITGAGAETILQTYHDDDLPASAQGWYFWPQPQAGGEVEIDPIGYYGFVPGGLYLEIYYQRAPSGTATGVWTDIYWAKQY